MVMTVARQLREAAAKEVREFRIAEAQRYLDARTGRYSWRCSRYDAAIRALRQQTLCGAFAWGWDCKLVDVGAGATEFGRRLFEQDYRGSYWPVDAVIDGVDLDQWEPARPADFFVALELLEHLDDPARLVRRMQSATSRHGAIVVSTPNPETTDVLGMDSTHRTEIHRLFLEDFGFRVFERSFYGKPQDSLFGIWAR